MDLSICKSKDIAVRLYMNSTKQMNRSNLTQLKPKCMGLQVYVDWVKLKNYMSMNIKLDSRFNDLEAKQNSIRLNY